MKITLKKKYLTPRVRDARVEVEGILCGSIVADPDVDELHNMTDSGEANYFDI